MGEESVTLQMEPGDHEREAFLTWYLGGAKASLEPVAAHAAVHGVEVLEERPFRVVRRDGLVVSIYQFVVRTDSAIPNRIRDRRDASAERFTAAVTAIWHNRAEVDRFNELVLRAGLTWQQVTVLRAYARNTCGRRDFPTASPLSNRFSSTTRGPRDRWSRCSRRSSTPTPVPKASTAGRAAIAVAADINALTSLTPTACCGIRGLIQATLRTNFYVTDPGQPGAQRVVGQAQFGVDQRIAASQTEIRDLRVFAAGGGCAPAIRAGRPWRAALVRSPGGLPH